MTRAPASLSGGGALGDAAERLTAAVAPIATVDGWATVELDRAELEVAALLADLGMPGVEDAREDRILGARTRVLRFGAGHRVILLEPSTEGRLAGALARHGEGYLARYLVVDGGAPERARGAGFTVAPERLGPLGPARLVVEGPRDGPFLILAGLD
jgi:hypothetical protein